MSYNTTTVTDNDITITLREALGVDELRKSAVQVKLGLSKDSTQEESFVFLYYSRILAQVDSASGIDIPSPFDDVEKIKTFRDELFYTPKYKNLSIHLMAAIDRLNAVDDEDLSPPTEDNEKND